MLEDLNKIVPKLDDNDLNNMYNALSKKSVGKKERTYKGLVFTLIAVAVLVIMVIPISIGIGVGVFNYNYANSKKIAEEIQSNAVTLDEKTLIGMAAYKPFDDKKTNINYKQSFYKSSDEEKDLIKVDDLIQNDAVTSFSYPFNYIMINSAYKFSIYVDQIDDEVANQIIEAGCGLKDLDVVVADFTTYDIDKYGTKNILIEDSLISIRGYNGYYTILENGATTIPELEVHQFSSHKTLSKDSLDKDFTPPIVTIFIEGTKKKNVYFNSGNKIIPINNYNSTKPYENIGTIERVSTDEIYSVLDIQQIETITVSATVNTIYAQNGYISVTTDYNLCYVFFAENTEGLNIKDLKVGDKILVEFDNYHDKYDPKVVYARKVTLDNLEV
jgi:hypothetical protein